MASIPTLLAYFSPETMLPLSSVLATIVGFALLVQRSSIRFVVHLCRGLIRRSRGPARTPAPHFAANREPAAEEAPR